MKWRAIKREERGRTYVDHVSDDGRWRLARGYGETGAGWSLFEADRYRREVPSLDVAKQALAAVAARRRG